MKWLREPLVHFLALGAGLFLLFRVASGPEDGGSGQIVVSAARVELLAQGFARTWQRPPTPEELGGLIEDHVREDVYYREALAMGLDRDDTIVRRRMRQKLEFFAADMLDAVDPTEEELSAYLAEHPERFRVASRVTFEHVFFNRDRRGEAAGGDAEKLRERLLAGEESRDVTQLGDRLPLPRKYTNVGTDKVARRFGPDFVERLAEMPAGEWAGPIESGYGLHLVRIREREPGIVPTLEDAREAVEREWRATRKEEAGEAFYQGLRERYEVIVEPPAAGETVEGSP